DINQIDEWKLFCPHDNEKDPYSLFFNNTRIKNHHMVVLGIREVDTKSYCFDKNLTFPWLYDQKKVHFTDDYSLRVFMSGCYYLDENNEWRADNLIVYFILSGNDNDTGLRLLGTEGSIL
ncbi:unnamed protein product, partial [Rotaria sp. Silwood1]